MILHFEAETIEIEVKRLECFFGRVLCRRKLSDDSAKFGY